MEEGDILFLLCCLLVGNNIEAHSSITGSMHGPVKHMYMLFIEGNAQG